MIRRREFITLVGGAVITRPVAVHAQQPVKLPKIGYLGLGSGLSSAYAKRVEALRNGLRALGWVEGKTIAIEFRWADKVDQLPALASELVRVPVDVIFANSSTQVEARPAGDADNSHRLFQSRRSGRHGARGKSCSARRQYHWTVNAAH